MLSHNEDLGAPIEESPLELEALDDDPAQGFLRTLLQCLPGVLRLFCHHHECYGYNPYRGTCEETENYPHCCFLSLR